MEHRILISGFGGQGALLIGKILCYAGMEEGKNVAWLPSYGPEMRGGTASCSVILSDGEIGSPQVTEPEYLIVFNEPSFDKFEPTVQSGGSLFVNSSLIAQRTARTDVEAYYVPCNDAAIAAGNARAMNMAMLGAFIARTGLLSKESILAGLRHEFGERRAHLVAVNELAMSKGDELTTK